jgi:hypothetical protein
VILAVPVTALALSARWLELPQVAIHIRGRLTTDGHPLARRQVMLTATGRGSLLLGRVRTAQDGSFGLHHRVVALSDWRKPATRRALERKFRYVVASFKGGSDAAAATVRVTVRPP